MKRQLTGDELHLRIKLTKTSTNFLAPAALIKIVH